MARPGLRRRAAAGNYVRRAGGFSGATPVCHDSGMLISTMNDVPGRQITEVLGEVTGLTVRSRNAGVQFGAGLKALVGGELAGLTKQLMQSREEAKQRLIEAAQAVGADAVIAMRFDASEVGQNAQEVVAYGTAVKLG